MAVDPSRTYHASQAMQLSELIALKFAAQRFGKSPARMVKVSEPDMSTDGGRKARQPMLLAPEKGDGQAIVFGFIDLTRRAAELRSYHAIKTQYESRHQGLLDITEQEYGKLLGTMREFVDAQQYTFELVELPPPRTTSKSGDRPPPGMSSGAAIKPRSGSNVSIAPRASAFQMMPLAIGFVAGTLFGFIVCYLMLRAT